MRKGKGEEERKRGIKEWNNEKLKIKTERKDSKGGRATREKYMRGRRERSEGKRGERKEGRKV